MADNPATNYSWTESVYVRAPSWVCVHAWEWADAHVDGVWVSGMIMFFFWRVKSDHITVPLEADSIHKKETPRSYTGAQTCTCATHRYCTWTCVEPDPCRESAHTVHSLQNEPSATPHLANDTLYWPITVRGINSNQPASKLRCHIKFSSLAESVFLLSSGQHVRLA